MVILYIFFYLILFLVAVLLIILSVPLSYCFEGRKYENATFMAEVHWPFKSIGISAIKDTNKEIQLKLTIFPLHYNLPFPSFSKPTTRKKQKKDKPKDQKKLKKARNKDFFNLEIIKKAFEMIPKFINRIKPKELSLSLRLGLEDPYYIGLLYGFLPFLHTISNNISITPVFNENIVEGECKIQGRIVLIDFVIILLQFLLSSPVRRIIFINMKRRKQHGI